MITRVTRSNLVETIVDINTRSILVFDCESTGLKPYHDSNVFSLAIADLDGNAWYFNFKSYKDLSDDFVLKPEFLIPVMKVEREWIAHNAKFDLHFLDKVGIKPAGRVHDTEVIARLYENHHQFSGGYSLSKCCERWLSVRKDDRVMEWMDANGAYTVYPNAEGRDTKHYYFDLVPFDMISEYAAQDAIVTGKLYSFLKERMYETNLTTMESDLIPVLFNMEKTGLRIDREYCQAAYEHEKNRVRMAELEFQDLTGVDFTDSAKCLEPIFTKMGIELPQTEKGNAQITDEVLSAHPENRIAKCVLEYRDATKRSNTYWSNYIFLADDKDTIHPNFRQSGTVTGRMSCNNPNLQNIPAEDSGPFPVRRAFVPRPGFRFVSIDFAQMEFRLMLEYAQQMDLIEKIKNGHDPHDSTAELTGLTRKAAKTLNFGLLYGMGVAKLAKAIGVADDEAKRFKYKYFDALPGVKGFIRESSRRMEARGYTFNWAGRRYILEDAKWSYKAANSIIQGGCADICKLAMVRLAEFLTSRRTRLVLQVHDEVLFEVADDEIGIVPDLKRIMENSFNARHMPMACSVAWSKENFHDMQENEEIK
jgi:DNA polymerase-1